MTRTDTCPARLTPARRLLRRLALPWLLALGATAAAAAPLPPYGLAAQAAFNHFVDVRTLDAFGQIDYAIPLNGQLRFNAAGMPSPLLTAEATMGDSPIAFLYGRSVGTLLYTIMVAGDPGPVDVEIDVAGFVSAAATVGASVIAESRWALENTSGFELASDRVASGLVSGGSVDDAFGRTVEITLEANREYRVRLFADAQSAATEPGSLAHAFAFIDPVFRFGAGVDAAAHAFTFSAGIGNGPGADPQPVSEPGTLAALAIGLVALARRRRALPAA